MKIVCHRSNSIDTRVFTCLFVISQSDLIVWFCYRKNLKLENRFDRRKPGLLRICSLADMAEQNFGFRPCNFWVVPVLAQRTRRNLNQGSAYVFVWCRQTCRNFFIFLKFAFSLTPLAPSSLSISTSCLPSRLCLVGSYHIIFTFLL